MILALHHADQDATLWINSFHSAFTDRVWLLFSGVKIWIPFYALVAGLLIWKLGWKRGLLAVVATALTAVACDQISVMIQEAVKRLRPCCDGYMLGNGLIALEGYSPNHMHGFPSAHATNCFGFATATTLAFSLKGRHYWKGYRAAVFIWATLVALSRVFVGKHYLGDLIAGALLGAALATIIFHLCCRIPLRLAANRQG